MSTRKSALHQIKCLMFKLFITDMQCKDRTMFTSADSYLWYWALVTAFLSNCKIKSKHELYKKYIQNGRFESDFIYLKNLMIELNELISSNKALYYENLAKKLNNLLLQAKTYWSVLKTFITTKNPTNSTSW